MDNMLDHYQAVLRDLEIRRARCQREVNDLDQTISGIRKLVSGTASLFVATPQVPTLAVPSPPPTMKFAGMSVRWAILNLLAEDASGPMKTGDIAQSLVNGGVTSKGKDFGANVSAVVSVMAKTRNEVEQAEDGGYRLTPNGRLAWAAIKHSPKYVNRDFSAIVQ